MNSAMTDYSLCGWRVRSDIALPELLSWTGDDREPDLRFVIGTVPAALDDPVFKTPIVQVDAAKRIRLEIDGVAVYLVEGGSRVTIAPQVAPGSPDLRLFLLGAAFGQICHQRGVMPIHATAVEVDGRAVLLAGASGAGKSTLAAAFLRRGHRILSDDVAPLDAGGWVLPSLQRIRLWRDSANQADWPVEELETCRTELQKYSRPLPDAGADKPLRPSALFHLSRPDKGEPETTIERLRGGQAVMSMRQQIYRWRSLVGLVTHARALARVGTAAQLIPRHFILKRPVRYDELDATVDAIIRAVRDVA